MDATRQAALTSELLGALPGSQIVCDGLTAQQWVDLESIAGQQSLTLMDQSSIGVPGGDFDVVTVDSPADFTSGVPPLSLVFVRTQDPSAVTDWWERSLFAFTGPV